MRVFAFLRGINVGGRRPKKDELIAAVSGPDLDDVSTFLASGNLLFESEVAPAQLEGRLSERLEKALGYEVVCFVRTLEELIGVVEELPELGRDEKHQVVFFAEPTDEETRRAYDEAAGETDTLRWRERELLWTHVGGMLDSPLADALPRLKVPLTTVRTGNTVRRLVAKFR